MITYRGVSIDHKGQRYSARYSVEDGLLCLDSAWGSARCKPVKDPMGLKEQAQKQLRRVVLDRERKGP